jgi:hypothetical protein
MYFYFDPAALQDRLKGAIAAVHAGGVLPLIASSDQGADDCQRIQRPQHKYRLPSLTDKGGLVRLAMIGAAALRIMSRIGAEAFEHSAALSTTAVDPEPL